MISVLLRPAGRAALVLAPLLGLLAVSLTALGGNIPSSLAGFLTIPSLSVLCAAASAWGRLPPHRWRAEAVFLGACAAAGPLWAIATAAVGKGLGAALRPGRPQWTAEAGDMVLICLSSCACLVLQMAGVESSAALGLVFVLLWRGAYFVGHRRAIGAAAPIFVPAGVAMALAGLVESGGPVWAIAGIIPATLMGLAAREEDKADRRTRETLQALALMLQRAHPYTHAHIERVARIAERTALHLGLSPDRALLVHEAARLHDIGKIAVDEEILDKPGPLSSDEYAHVKLHAPFGATILEEIEELRSISDWIRAHHERPDGKGYPKGLRGNEIPLEARIIAVADAFDAMTGGFTEGERRPYRAPVSPDEALVEMERCSGTQFDREVVTSFREALKEESAA